MRSLWAHDMGAGRWQCAEPGPHPTKPDDVEEAFAVVQADGHPLVMIGKLAASSLSAEASPTGIDSAQGLDEAGEIERECR